MNHNDTLYTESQKFRQWWLWLLIVCMNLFFISMLFKNLIIDADFIGSQQGVSLLSSWLFVLALSLFFLSMKLETLVREDGIYVRFSPIHRKHRVYLWQDLEQVYMRKYEPLGEYGGWGLRGLGNNRALNVSGNVGLQLVLKDGRRMLIGTQKAEELSEVLIKLGRHS